MEKLDWNAIGEQNIKKQAMAFFTESFERFYERSIATDEKGVVRWLSPAYAQFLELDDAALGKHITEIIPNSKVPRVIEQGEPIFLRLMYVNSSFGVQFSLKSALITNR
ncbi:MAG: hypothetical protein ACPGPF_06795, partial [Pontibacterium sp.]